MICGISGSAGHPENGMPKSDMEACLRVADQLNEVIIFRSTGPWSMRWIERGYPTKNFHVKGKSSDWGPQAGFVPYKGVYSKVGHDPAKAEKGTKANDHGIKDNFAAKTHLTLTMKELEVQVSRPSGKPFRKVHHNAESHRNHIFGAITGSEMAEGEAFPLTVFQPGHLQSGSSPTRTYTGVSTLETLPEFKQYAVLLNEAGYYVPRNWTWGMSIRDSH